MRPYDLARAGLRRFLQRSDGTTPSSTRSSLASSGSDFARLEGRECVDLEFDGDRFTCVLDPDRSDAYVDWIRAGAHAEGPVVWARRLVEPDHEVLALGANLGIFSFALAHHCHGVVAVEANPDVAQLLTEAAGINELPVTPVHAAVWDSPGEVQIAGSSAWGQVVADTEGAQTVSAHTVSQLIERYHSSTPALVKIDIEGAEEVVLPDMFAALADRPSSVVIYESNQYSTEKSVAGLHRTAREYGFDLWYLDHANGTPTKVIDDIPQTSVYCDVLALRGRTHPSLPATAPSTDVLIAQLSRELTFSNGVHRGYAAAVVERFPTVVQAAVRELVEAAGDNADDNYRAGFAHQQRVRKASSGDGLG